MNWTSSMHKLMFWRLATEMYAFYYLLPWGRGRGMPYLKRQGCASSMFKVGVIRYIPKNRESFSTEWRRNGLIRYKIFKKGGHWVNATRNTCKWGSLGTDLQKGVIGYRFTKRGQLSTKRLNLLKSVFQISTNFKGPFGPVVLTL